METNNTFMTIRCNRSFNEMKSSVLRLLQGQRDILLDKRITDEEDARYQNHTKRCGHINLYHFAEVPLVGETLYSVEHLCEKGYALVYNRNLLDAETLVQTLIQHDVCHKLICGLFKNHGKKEWQNATIVVPVGRFGNKVSLEWLKKSGLEYEMCNGNVYKTTADFIQRHSNSEASFVSLYVSGKASFYPERINSFYRNEIIDGVKENISIENVEHASTFQELNDCIFMPKAKLIPDWVNAERNRCYYHCAMFESASTSPNNFLIKSCNTADMLLFIDKPLGIVNKACKEGYAIVRCGKERVKIGDTSIAEGMIDFFKKNNILHKMVCGCFAKDNEISWGIAFVVTGENLELLKESGYDYEVFSFDGSVDRNVDTFMVHHFGEDVRYDGTYVNPWPSNLSERLPRHFTHEIGMMTDINKFEPTMNSKIQFIKYFHPSGRDLPNGSHYQKGGFLDECRRNANAFILSETVFGTQSSMSKKYGGVLVLPATVSAANEENEVFVNSIKQLIEGQKEHIKAYSVGNFFKGKYVSVSGYVYDETSICIAVNIVSCKALYALAKTTAHRFNTDEVLVKNLNNSSYVLCWP